MLQSFVNTITKILQNSGFANMDLLTLAMILISFVLMYLAIGKKFEPLLLLPIAFGMLLANLPLAGLTNAPEMVMKLMPTPEMLAAGGYDDAVYATATEIAKYSSVLVNGQQMVAVEHAGGLLYYLYLGVKLGIYPPLIFLGIGCMTDFGPLIANPRSFLLGAAAQVGIFITFFGAMFLGFTPAQSGAIGIIGGADGPTAIWLTSQLAPELLGSIAIAAYSYMALVPIIQPPIMKALTTKKERQVVMGQLRPVSKTEKVIFPIMVTVVVALLLPDAAPLVGMLMLGNLLKESGVTARLVDTAQNALMNIITIFLGVTVGATAKAETFLTKETLFIVVLGLIAFCMGTACGVLFGKLMYIFTKGKINPLIGSAGVSAVPMAARVAQKVGQEDNPSNFLLMHAMGPNVAGVIGSAVAAGVLLNILK